MCVCACVRASVLACVRDYVDDGEYESGLLVPDFIETLLSRVIKNSESLKVGQSHPIWSTVRLNTLDNKRAQLKCKILTGTYILQGNRAVFNQYAVDPTCKLCLKSPETRQHFIAECPVFEYERQEFLGKVKTNTDLLNSKNALDGNLQNPETLTQLVLDASAVIETHKRQSEILDKIELHTREYIYKIHQKRIAKLKQISQS